MYCLVLHIVALSLCAETCVGVFAQTRNNQNLQKYLLQLDEIHIDEKNAEFFTLAIGLFTQIDSKLFQQSVDKVLETYNQHPETLTTLGVFISIAFLRDSIDDHDKIALYEPFIEDALQDQNEYSRLKKLKGIQSLLEADVRRQKSAGSIKALFALGFGAITTYTSISWLFWPSIGATAITTSAALINTYNYHQFSILLRKLRKDGHLK